MISSNDQINEYPSAMDFLKECAEVAERCGYGLDKGHPEDHVATMIPIMEAYAAGWARGWAVGYSRGRSRQ